MVTYSSQTRPEEAAVAFCVFLQFIPIPSSQESSPEKGPFFLEVEVTGLFAF